MPIKPCNGNPLRVRQIDVARRAGVSQATVSMVLSDGDVGARRMSQATRRRVLAVAQDLGYSVNPVARNLVGGRNRLLGVYTFEPVFPTEARDFYQEFFLGIEHAAELVGYDLLLFTSASVPGRRRGIYAGGVNRLSMSDGSILLGRNSNKRDVERLCGEGFPFVYIGRRDLDGGEMSYVTADYAAATTEVTRYVVKHGHRHVAYIRTVSILEPEVDRVDGWSKAVVDLGLGGAAPLIRTASKGIDVETLVQLRLDGVTAIIVEDPQAARHVFAAARDAGLRVPDDLSIAVLGDDPSSAPVDESWTGFRIPREAMGRAAVTLLLEQLDEPDAKHRHLSLPCAFKAGETVSRPPRADWGQS